jgi:hypothetical protein
MAKSFEDIKGRTWSIRITFGIVDNIAEELGDDLIDDPTSISLHPRRWVEMLWICVEEQAKEQGVTPQDFGASLDGATLRNAMNLFMEDFSDFLSPLHPDGAAVVKNTWNLVMEGRETKADLLHLFSENPSTELLGLLESTLDPTDSGKSSASCTEHTPKQQKRRRRKRPSKGKGKNRSQ